MNPFIIDSLCPPKQGQNDQEKKGFAGGSEVRSRPQNRITATKKATSLSADGFGPSGESRTHGLLNPIQARYQTALHPDVWPGVLTGDVIYYSASLDRCQLFFQRFFKNF